MFNLDSFIYEYVTKRPSSMFEQDIRAYDVKLHELIGGKSVLVIGGAGSIGSSFIRAILPFKPAELVVVDTNENALTELTRSLRSNFALSQVVPDIYLPYPMDYNTAGMLLADPHEMTPDFWGSVGMLLGWTLSGVIERRFIQFDCGGTKGRKAVRFLVGAILFALVYEVAMPALVAGLDPNLGKFLQRFAAFIAAGCLYPAAIKFVQNRSKNTLGPTTQP